MEKDNLIEIEKKKSIEENLKLLKKLQDLKKRAMKTSNLKGEK